MARDLFSRYIWIVDTLSRYGKLSRKRLNELWLRSAQNDGKEIPERTFFHYRRAIEENFNIDIVCNEAGEYSIAQPDTERNRAFSNWLLDSYAVRSAIGETDNEGARIVVDDVPSAREFLPSALEAAKYQQKILFSYAGFNRSRTEEDILFMPCFLRLYRQRWYMVGYKESKSARPALRTYALDRVKKLVLTGEKFEMPEDIDADEVFGNIIGVTSSHAKVRIVRLQTTPRQAKYFRALPLHSSQSEEVHEFYSIFTYKLKLNYELVHEILSLGAEVKVLDPPELKAMLLDELAQLNELYKNDKK